MMLLAVTLCTVLTLTPVCSDDWLRFSPSDAPDLAGYRVHLNNSLVGNPIQPAFNLGCSVGTACVSAVDRAGNQGASSCFNWQPDPGMLLVVERPCGIGCRRPKRDSRCCTAPATVLPQGE